MSSHDTPVDVAPNNIGGALDSIRLDEIARLAGLAASYWHSIELAADRGDELTVQVHCRQVVQVTREVLSAVKTLESNEVEP